jgi:hypothetical protein
MTTHHHEQHGDYVIELPAARALWRVRMAGAEEVLSEHNTKRDALAAVARYRAADTRRRQAVIDQQLTRFLRNRI